MLPKTWRLSAYNDTNAAIAVTAKVELWKIGAAGAVTRSAELTLLNAFNVVDLGLGASATQDNTADGYYGLFGLITLGANAGGGGLVTIFLEESTDGGTTWPDAQQGIPLGAGLQGQKFNIVA